MVSKEKWGVYGGRDIHLYTIRNAHGLEAAVSEYGALLVSLRVPDRRGGLDDVLLGYDTLQEYVDDRYYLGAMLGRCANRIAKPDFQIFGKPVSLHRNEGAYHLHGGEFGFHKQVWSGQTVNDSTVALQRVSPDGEEGYPGNLAVTIYFTLTPDDALTIRYVAVCDQDTVVSLCSHGYFNLSGQGSGSTVLEDRIQVRSDYFVEINADCAMTGAIRCAAGTPMDLRSPVRLGDAVSADYDQLRLGSGFNHTFVLAQSHAPAATLWDDRSGRRMDVFTDAPGVHLYSGNYLDGPLGKGGARYPAYGAMCFETQYYPDAVNMPHFPSPVLPAGKAYQSQTSFRFTTF